jgi:hypothetical protein
MTTAKTTGPPPTNYQKALALLSREWKYTDRRAHGRTIKVMGALSHRRFRQLVDLADSYFVDQRGGFVRFTFLIPPVRSTR